MLCYSFGWLVVGIGWYFLYFWLLWLIWGFCWCGWLYWLGCLLLCFWLCCVWSFGLVWVWRLVVCVGSWGWNNWCWSYLWLVECLVYVWWWWFGWCWGWYLLVWFWWFLVWGWLVLGCSGVVGWWEIVVGWDCGNWWLIGLLKLMVFGFCVVVS